MEPQASEATAHCSVELDRNERTEPSGAGSEAVSPIGEELQGMPAGQVFLGAVAETGVVEGAKVMGNQ